MSYDWNVQKYIDLVENNPTPVFQGYIKTEQDYLLTKVKKSSAKTFIDVGAGYGRVIPQLSKIAKQVIAVEIDKQMLSELKRRTRQYHNVLVIEGDANNLSGLLKDTPIGKPVVISLQNSLGTPIGDPYKIISEMVKVARTHNGELLISVLCQEALKGWGVNTLYPSIQEMTGEPDLEKTDFQKGIFVSKTGYKSNWRTEEERKRIKEMVDGEVVKEIQTKYFYILHTEYL